MLRIGVAAAVFVIALTSTGSARGSDLPLFNFHRGDTVAIAIWRSADAQVVVAARHTATTDLNQGEGPPHQKDSNIFLCIQQPGRTICNRNATLSDDDFQVDRTLDTAVMKAVVPAEECSGVPVTCTEINLHIDLTWTASGPVDRNRFHNKLFAQVCHINEVGSLVSRHAEVRGSISDGTRQFIAGLDTVEATISKARLAWTGRGDEFCL